MDVFKHKAKHLIIKTTKLALTLNRIRKCFSLILASACLLLSCLLVSLPVYAKKPSILIVADTQIKIHQQISTHLKEILLNEQSFSVEINPLKDKTQQQITLDKPSLIITLGVKAAKLAPPSSISTLYTLISENNLQEISVCKTPNCKNKSLQSTHSFAILLDQPLARQLNFLSLLLPTAKRIGVLTAPFSLNKLKSLYTESEKLKLTLITRYLDNESMLSRELNTLINQIDVLFALPDPLIHNKNNIPNLLLSTYRYNIPVIGFSKTYVNAGAIAAIYSSPEQITKHIAELAQKIITTPASIKYNYTFAKYFSIAINKSVARSLELHLPDKQKIKSLLLQLEK